MCSATVCPPWNGTRAMATPRARQAGRSLCSTAVERVATSRSAGCAPRNAASTGVWMNPETTSPASPTCEGRATQRTSPCPANAAWK